MNSSFGTHESRLIIHAPAKVNLRLEVLSRRSDGYHELQMINACLDLHDSVEIRKVGAGIHLHCDDPSLSTGEDNLAWRAADAIMKHTGLAAGVEIRIAKSIPIGAGLGGGSSDAAAVLLGVNRLFGLGLSGEVLREIGLGLGADVPYFIHGGPAVVRGIGERISACTMKSNLSIILINPGFMVSTKSVYGEVASNLTLPQKATNLPAALGGPPDVVRLLRNDLDAVVSSRHPEIAEMKSVLLSMGAIGAMMSGSGPTVFGVFRDDASRPKAQEIGAGKNWRVIPATTVAGGAW